MEGLTGLGPAVHFKSSQPFVPALVFICLAPSFPGTHRRGTLLSQRLSTPGGREALGSLSGVGPPISAAPPSSLQSRFSGAA